MIIGYVQMYCTDVLRLNLGLVGTLLLATKPVDGFTDLVDRIDTKIGRGKPYEITILGLWFCTWLVFSVPEQFTVAAKCAWVVIAYTLAQSVCATLLNTSQTVYMAYAFNNQKHYVILSSLGGLVTVVGVAVFNVCLPMMMANAWMNAAVWWRWLRCLLQLLVLCVLYS